MKASAPWSFPAAAVALLRRASHHRPRRLGTHTAPLLSPSPPSPPPLGRGVFVAVDARAEALVALNLQRPVREAGPHGGARVKRLGFLGFEVLGF
jgi:hypothetical protein